VTPGGPAERLDTAHALWDERWSDAAGRAPWSVAEPQVVATFDRLLDRGATAVLDLGAGVGRHAFAYARAGLRVVALDASTRGVAEVAAGARADGLTVATAVAGFTAVPLAAGSVDHVLAWNVLYHGDTEVAARGLRECARVLRGEGTLQCTMLSTRHRSFGVGREVRPHTFVDEESPSDKRHPHVYVDEDELVALLARAGFRVDTMDDVDQQPEGSFHWTVSAERR